MATPKYSKFKEIIANPVFQRWGNIILLVGAAVVYFGQAIHFAFTERSIIDEGLYLYKGLLFARNVYLPFQDYGFWTQKAPLAYLIYGWVQQLFGAGLRSGRFFSIAVGALALVGLWLTARRTGGRWWATGAVWVVALNPAALKYYSMAMTQSLMACMLIWVLFFAMGRRASRWSIAAAGLLTGIMVMTRQNMAPVVLLLILYVFWRRGWRDGLVATGACLLPLVVINGIYFPEILKMWAALLPRSLTPFLDRWRLFDIQTTNLVPTRSQILQSIFDGFRFHFVALTGGLLGLLFLPVGKEWKDREERIDNLFLASLFVVLLVVHTWGGLGNTSLNNNNAFTFGPYLFFYDFTGILLLISALKTLKERPIPRWKQALAVFLLVIVSAGVGKADFDTLGDSLANLSMPRFKNFFTTFHFEPGQVALWKILANKFGLSYTILRTLIPTAVLFVIGVLIVLACAAIWLSARKRQPIPYALAAFITIVFLVMGGVLAPTPVLAGGFREWDCGGNTIEAFEKVGNELNDTLDRGSLVYWSGDNAIAVLTYVDDIRIFPQQLDGNWNFSQEGDAEMLAKFGFWDDSLGERWRGQADVFLFQEEAYRNWKSYVNTEEFDEPPRDETPLNCDSESYLRVFIREK